MNTIHWKGTIYTKKNWSYLTIKLLLKTHFKYIFAFNMLLNVKYHNKNVWLAARETVIVVSEISILFRAPQTINWAYVWAKLLFNRDFIPVFFFFSLLNFNGSKEKYWNLENQLLHRLEVVHLTGKSKFLENFYRDFVDLIIAKEKLLLKNLVIWCPHSWLRTIQPFSGSER